MKNIIVILLVALISPMMQARSNKELAKTIIDDATLSQVQSMAEDVLKQGFNAGSGYSQVWARDMNTFKIGRASCRERV